MESAQDFLERPYASQEHSGNAVEQGTSSGRTYLEPSAPTMEMTFEPCSKKSARPMFQCLHLTSGQGPAWSAAPLKQSQGLTVRRFTPLECERLQGLPEGWTQDGAEKDRLQALGNGMAQPCADFVMAGIAHYATLAEAAGMLRQEHEKDNKGTGV